MEVFIGSQRKGVTEKQLTELETRLNETVAQAITTSQDAFFQSAYGQLLNELKNAVYSELEAQFNATVVHVINVAQDSFYLQLYTELSSRLSQELNTTLQSEVLHRLKTALYDDLLHDLLAATLNASVSNNTALPSQPATELPPSAADTVCCGVREGWRRIAYLNMTDPSHSCPPAWRD